MNPEYIKKIAEMWQQVAEKKAMDPVDQKALKGKHADRKDKDIDNDGDVDKSDEYLHKRRQAISKSMKKESEDEIELCPKCDGSMQNHDPECPMAKQEASCGKMKKESVELDERVNTDKARKQLGNIVQYVLSAHSGISGLSSDADKLLDAMPNGTKHYRALYRSLSEAKKVADALGDNLRNAQRWDAKLLEANDEESVELDEEQIPTGIKIHHDSPQGKKSHTIVFTAQDANRVHKELKKDGRKIHGHSLMYGKKEGPFQKFNESTDMFNEAKDLDKTNADKAIVHDCATHVASEQYGYGECIAGQHTIAESEDGVGYVTHYDVMFEHGVEFNVPVSELTVLASSMHGHKRKKKNENVKEASSYEKHTKGAAKAETLKDQRKGKGANDMAKDLDADSPEVAADDAKGHEDATKAGRVVSKQAPTRGQEKRVGDTSIVNPVKGAVTKTTGKEGI